MALKITSGGWIAAQIENREQRNAERSKAFAATGLARAASLRDVHVPLPARAARIEALFAPASGNRIGDEGLREASVLAASALAQVGLGRPASTVPFEHQTWGILALSPEVLKAFFLSDHDTPLERSMFDE